VRRIRRRAGQYAVRDNGGPVAGFRNRSTPPDSRLTEGGITCWPFRGRNTGAPFELGMAGHTTMPIGNAQAQCYGDRHDRINCDW